MAWISVHEQVIGGKLRSLAKEIGCSQNEALGLLVRLWLWGINNADKEGRIIGAEKADVAEILTVGRDARFSPDQIVDALVETNWIDIDDGLYLHDWEDWQEQWYKAIAIRERDAERKRRSRSTRKITVTETVKIEVPEEIKVEDDLPKPKLLIPPDPPKKPEKKVETDDYPDGFNQFWDIYPKKVGKGDAYKKYKARINSGWSPEELLEAAKNYAGKVIRERVDKQYIKHPKTFLSDTEPFTDYLPKKTEVKAVAVNEDDPYAEWR